MYCCKVTKKSLGLMSGAQYREDFTSEWIYCANLSARTLAGEVKDTHSICSRIGLLIALGILQQMIVRHAM